MSGDWIKMRTDLHDQPEVIGISRRCNLDVDAVAGKLLRIWSWADRVTQCGRVPFTTASVIDGIARRKGFADAMQSVGWLEVREDEITFPKFDRHNGKSAKSRAEKNRRVAESRARQNRSAKSAQNAHTSGTKSATREEKRREEINTPPDPPPGGWESVSASEDEKPPGRGKPAKPEDAAASRVVARYQSAVAPAHGPEGAVTNVAKLLGAGRTEEELVRCADGYAAACRDKEPKYRMKARNFYGRDAGYKDYLECETPKPMTDDERKAKWEQERQAWLGTPYAPG